jgi:hypothetical protein
MVRNEVRLWREDKKQWLRSQRHNDQTDEGYAARRVDFDLSVSWDSGAADSAKVIDRLGPLQCGGLLASGVRQELDAKFETDRQTRIRATLPPVPALRAADRINAIVR